MKPAEVLPAIFIRPQWANKNLALLRISVSGHSLAYASGVVPKTQIVLGNLPHRRRGDKFLTKHHSCSKSVERRLHGNVTPEVPQPKVSPLTWSPRRTFLTDLLVS